MKFRELIKKYHEKKIPVFVNGIGVGKITNVFDDYISFEVIEKKEEDKKKKIMREVTHITISDKMTISEGQKEVPQTMTEQEIGEDLEGL